MSAPLFPRPPRRMHQPTKDQLREAIASLTLELERQRAEVARLRQPWWRRARQRAAARLAALRRARATGDAA